jgi:hypothetical protein
VFNPAGACQFNANLFSLKRIASERLGREETDKSAAAGRDAHSKRGPMFMCKVSKAALMSAVIATALLLPDFAAAQDYRTVVERIVEAGKLSPYGKYLEFLEGDTRQYADVKIADDLQHIVLTFIEEHWSKSGEKDVIEQWIVQVSPNMEVYHHMLVELHSEVLETRQLSTEGAEKVVKRIADKAIALPPSQGRD